MICSVFGHSEILITEALKMKLYLIFEDLIVNKNYEVFLFGGFGQFDELCWEIITELKIKKYPFIKRIFCLSDPKHVNGSKRPKWMNSDDYEDFWYLTFFDYWYTRIYYRNCAMIDKSDFVVFYAEKKTSSGAYKAYQYALKKKKNNINLFE